jgi:hypothetical protein
MPPAPASNGCSQPTKPAPKWVTPTPTRRKSHNHCAEVLVKSTDMTVALQPFFNRFRPRSALVKKRRRPPMPAGTCGDMNPNSGSKGRDRGGRLDHSRRKSELWRCARDFCGDVRARGVNKKASAAKDGHYGASGGAGNRHGTSVFARGAKSYGEIGVRVDLIASDPESLCVAGPSARVSRVA